MFAKYEKYLDGVKEFDNYWSDVGLSEAVEILERFSDSDWKIIDEKIHSKSKIWLVSCAETLGDDVGGENSFKLLIKLLSSESDEVKIAALDSINSRLSFGFVVDNHIEKIRSVIKVARLSTGILVSMMLDSLEKKLG